MAGDFVESFDNGIGALDHVWGSANIDTGTHGQVTISGHGGLMEKPTGDSAGHGYGTYTVVAALDGDTEGSAALLWPGNDKWPGPEYDIVEVIHGNAYGTVHFAGSDGGDRYNVVNYDGVDESQTHTYSLDWQPGSITYYVDGHNMGSVSEDVGADYAHGGINEVMGLMNRSDATSMTVYEVSYSSSGGGGSEPADTGVVTSSADAHDDTTVSVDAPVDTVSADTGSSSEPVWWDAWEAAWDANHGSGDDSWQAKFWASQDWQV